jgi:hypothetical protein
VIRAKQSVFDISGSSPAMPGLRPQIVAKPHINILDFDKTANKESMHE